RSAALLAPRPRAYQNVGNAIPRNEIQEKSYGAQAGSSVGRFVLSHHDTAPSSATPPMPANPVPPVDDALTEVASEACSDVDTQAVRIARYHAASYEPLIRCTPRPPRWRA